MIKVMAIIVDVEILRMLHWQAVTIVMVVMGLYGQLMIFVTAVMLRSWLQVLR